MMDEVQQQVAWIVCGGFTGAALLGVVFFYVFFYPSYRDRRRRRP